MKKALQDLSAGALALKVDEESMFDKRSLLIGVGLAALLLTGATLWKIAYHEKSGPKTKLQDFEISAPRPPKEVEKFEYKDPLRPMMRPTVVDQPAFSDERETPNIQISTNPQEVENPTEVVKTTKLTMDIVANVKGAKLDLNETKEMADEQGDVSVDRLTPIAVLKTSPGDILAYDEPISRPSARAGLVSTSPNPGAKLMVAFAQLGDQDQATIGELGAVDINLFGNGDGYGGGGGGFKLETRTAVDSALRWLALHQEPQGFWIQYKWDADDVPVGGAVTGSVQKGVSEFGVTCLATLALMGGGNTLRKGEHRMAVLRAINHIVSQQDRKTGILSQNMYEHAIGTIALCEAFGRSPDETVGIAARRAVDACVGAVKKDGGWRYDYGPSTKWPVSDTSVSSWFMQALKTAKLANIKFDHAVFSKGLTYMDQCTDRGGMADSRGGVSYEYNASLSYGRGSPALTCAGMVIRQFNGMGVNHPLLVRAAELTKKDPPDWDKKKDFYYWYYATYAMHNMGGEPRLFWNRRIREVLLDHQSKRGHQSGSWSPEKESWAQGRVYTTAMGALCLEVAYRYGAALQSFGTVANLDELTFE
jgi:hypothetical protein